MKFVDEVKIKVRSGRGGSGCVSFRRESKQARGGPDGGDGGRGGHVIFRTSTRKRSLLELKQNPHMYAGNGDSGRPRLCTGKSGSDVLIEVPQGTVIKDGAGQMLFELTATGQERIFLKGGRGGKGNHFFKTSINQAPEHSQPGESGFEESLQLELKLMADFGIIGLPNAGKSTLISRLSAAKPKVANYPFTTLAPQLGVVKFKEVGSFVIADIPGLIPGAHRGEGLGLQFLRHIERTSAFVHLIDASDWSGTDPLEAYDQINHELKQYDEAQAPTTTPLSERTQLIALNKVDTVDSERLDEVKRQFEERGLKVMTLSAATGQGLSELLNQMGELIFASKPN